MDKDTFWRIIDDCRAHSDEGISLHDCIIDQLVQLPTEDIIGFEQNLWDRLAESYRWDLWAVAYIVNGGCSDDGFDYFRGWLIAQGRQRWETAMAAPETIGNWTDGEEEDEEMLTVAFQAYKRKTGKEIVREAVTVNLPSSPKGEPWEEEDLPKLYPSLCEKFA